MKFEKEDLIFLSEMEDYKIHICKPDGVIVNRLEGSNNHERLNKYMRKCLKIYPHDYIVFVGIGWVCSYNWNSETPKQLLLSDFEELSEPEAVEPEAAVPEVTALNHLQYYIKECQRKYPNRLDLISGACWFAAELGFISTEESNEMIESAVMYEEELKKASPHERASAHLMDCFNHLEYPDSNEHQQALSRYIRQYILIQYQSGIIFKHELNSYLDTVNKILERGTKE